jgi:hypothetical protein
VVRPGLETYPNGRGKLGFRNLHKSQLGSQTRFGSSSKRSGKNCDSTLCQITIRWSDPVWKFIQTVGEKLGFGIYINLNWVIRHGLEVHPNSRGKIVIRHFVKSQLGGQTRFGNLSKRLGKNWDLEFTQISIGWSDPIWKFIQTVGEKIEIWNLHKSQLGSQTRFGSSSKRSGKNCDSTLCQIAIGWSDPVWKFIQTVGEKLGFGIYTNLNWVVRPSLEIYPNGQGKN